MTNKQFDKISVSKFESLKVSLGNGGHNASRMAKVHTALLYYPPIEAVLLIGLADHGLVLVVGPCFYWKAQQDHPPKHHACNLRRGPTQLTDLRSVMGGRADGGAGVLHGEGGELPLEILVHLLGLGKE